ncbi:MAG: peptidoglycan/xylan/chitin deacetylase (PgdA/CDA1 family) [Crocinitomicaceae bacterium]|jgi:peptidoglycan/xylan/chitin deacetylase (PgdA/CDA1 family)
MPTEGYGDYREFQDSPPSGPVHEMDNVPENKYVYLTFDDGLQPGTREIIDVLESQGVPGTFFLVGVHTEFYLKHVEKGALGLNLMKRLHRKHLIANHSYSHANNKYGHTYSSGVYLPRGVTPRSVLEDFQKNEAFLEDTLISAGVYSGEEMKFKIARFPGRNTWRINGVKSIAGGSQGDTSTEAEELFRDNYKIYGWDSEWDVNFNIDPSYLAPVEAVAHFDPESDPNEEVPSWEWAEGHPFYDFSADDLDQLSESAEEVAGEIMTLLNNPEATKRPGKVILLLHDRYFRDLQSTKPVERLRQLIEALKLAGVKFSTLDRY